MKALIAFFAKYWLHILVAILIIAALVWSYNKFQRGQNRRRAQDDLVNWDPVSAARKLNAAMEGWGTNEEMIWSVLEGLTPSQLAALYNAYQAEYNRDLFADFQSELAQYNGEYQRAMAYFNAVQLT
jgi:hypothetical protein